MSKPKVFIDGHAGTIGLRIRELLRDRDDITVLDIDEADRKDAKARQAKLNACDLAILCLPDEASREAMGLIENDDVKVIDGSTAYRVAEGWAYGMPELGAAHRQTIMASKRVANPGCWPSCVTLLLRPLVQGGLLAVDSALTIHGVSGYSGGGKAMIARWQASDEVPGSLPYPWPYAIATVHKHIPEMMTYGGLEVEPMFQPSVAAFERGMRVTIPLHAAQLKGVTAEALHDTWAEQYAHEPFIRVMPTSDAMSKDETTFDPRSCNGSNQVKLWALGHASGHATLVAVLDNLGKGASGAAVQNMNLMLGMEDATGL